MDNLKRPSKSQVLATEHATHLLQRYREAVRGILRRLGDLKVLWAHRKRTGQYAGETSVADEIHQLEELIAPLTAVEPLQFTQVNQQLAAHGVKVNGINVAAETKRVDDLRSVSNSRENAVTH